MQNADMEYLKYEVDKLKILSPQLSRNKNVVFCFNLTKKLLYNVYIEGQCQKIVDFKI